jgi:hypothetical protein
MSAMSGGATVNGGPAVPASLSVEYEQIDVTVGTKTEPDWKWTYVDQAGHFHAWSDDTDRGQLPTLTSGTEHHACDFGHGADCEGYDVTVYSCAICGEEIEPKTVSHSPMGREYMRGRMTWTVQVEQHVGADPVSVRLTAPGVTYFGVAARTRSSLTLGETPRTTLVGISPLGRRKQPAAS